MASLSSSSASPSTAGAAAAAAGAPRHQPPGLFLPVLLLALALVGWLLFQTTLLIIDRGMLNANHAAQQQTVDNAARLRASLDALAADTQRLADGGNPNAGALVAELRKRGITINPNPPGGGAAGAPAAAASR